MQRRGWPPRRPGAVCLLRVGVAVISVAHCCSMAAPLSRARAAWSNGLSTSCFVNHVQPAGRGSPKAAADALLRRPFHGSTALGLNRLLFEPEEVTLDGPDCCSVVLPAEDPRAVHVRKILGNEDGDTLRVGVLDAGRNDSASMRWLSDRSLHVQLGPTDHMLRPVADRPRVDLLLAMQAPLRLERMVPQIASLGVDRLFITGGNKVVTSYWGSHLLRKPETLRALLVEGLTAAGDTAVPRVSFHRRLKVLLRDELPVLYPAASSPLLLRAIAHPFRPDPTPEQLASNYDTRLRDLWPPPEALLQSSRGSDGRARLLLAVGPESGWEEPYELEMFRSFGFQQVSMGARVLRTETAVPALLALAHDQLHAIDRRDSSGSSSKPPAA